MGRADANCPPPGYDAQLLTAVADGLFSYDVFVGSKSVRKLAASSGSGGGGPNTHLGFLFSPKSETGRCLQQPPGVLRWADVSAILLPSIWFFLGVGGPDSAPPGTGETLGSTRRPGPR